MERIACDNSTFCSCVAYFECFVVINIIRYAPTRANIAPDAPTRVIGSPTGLSIANAIAPQIAPKRYMNITAIWPYDFSIVFDTDRSNSMLLKRCIIDACIQAYVIAQKYRLLSKAYLENGNRYCVTMFGGAMIPIWNK